MNSWFRFYREVLHDAKVQLLDPLLFKFWINCLCLACETDGYLPSPVAVSFAFHLPETTVSEFIEILMHSGLIETKRGTWYVHNWHKRQYKSDNSTERVKQFRKRFRNATSTVSETPPEQIQNRAETEQKKDKEPPSAFRVGEFEKLWGEYPSKDGKKAALKSFNASVKTLADLARIKKALANYCGHLQRHPQKPVKNGSTWFNNWEDWVMWEEPGQNNHRMPDKPVPVC